MEFISDAFSLSDDGTIPGTIVTARRHHHYPCPASPRPPTSPPRPQPSSQPKPSRNDRRKRARGDRIGSDRIGSVFLLSTNQFSLLCGPYERHVFFRAPSAADDPRNLLPPLPGVLAVQARTRRHSGPSGRAGSFLQGVFGRPRQIRSFERRPHHDMRHLHGGRWRRAHRVRQRAHLPELQPCVPSPLPSNLAAQNS